MSVTREPEWTAENLNRRRGDTNFKICGWCEYNNLGLTLHDCTLETSCCLLREYSDFNKNLSFDNPCIIYKLGREDIISCAAYKVYQIRNCESTLKKHKEELKILGKLNNPDIPVLAENRNADHFNIKGIVWVFHGDKWNKGTVVKGYRHHDGCVSYVLDDYPESGQKGGWGCGVNVPCILLDKEFKFFKKNLDLFQIWLRLSDKSYNGKKLELDKYFVALKEK